MIKIKSYKSEALDRDFLDTNNSFVRDYIRVQEGLKKVK